MLLATAAPAFISAGWAMFLLSATYGSPTEAIPLSSAMS